MYLTIIAKKKFLPLMFQDVATDSSAPLEITGMAEATTPNF
jgi:hypothetical protein